MAVFFPSIGPAAPFEMRQKKTWLQLPKSSMMIKEKQQEFVVKKRKENQQDGAAARSHFPYWCGKNHVIYDDPSHLSSFQYPSSIQSLILKLFGSVLGPKKNPSNQPHELGLYPSRDRIFCLHVRYSNGNILSF